MSQPGPPQGFAVPVHQAAVLASAPGQPPAILYAPQGAAAGGTASTSAPRLAALPPRLNLSAGMVGAPGMGSFSMASPSIQGGSALQAVQQIYGGAAANGMAQRSPIRKPNQGMPQPKGARKQCNCKNSRCLKLYCECFASGRYCDNCNCLNCFNNRESEIVRQSAVEAILERNPNAFRPKIQPNETLDAAPAARTADGTGVRHTKGCNCKKSFCLKKYCECFQAGIYCSDMCKCIDCKNFDGSDARSQVLSTQELMAAHQHGGGIKRQRVTVPLIPSPVGAQAQQHQQQMHSFQRPQQQQAQTPLQLMPMLPNGLGSQQQRQQQHQQALSAPQQLQLQQMQALSALQAGALSQPVSTPAVARNPRLDVVNEVVKQGVIEELCRLLILVADEEADKVQQRAEQQQQQRQQWQEASTTNGVDGSVRGGDGIKAEHGNGNGIADGTTAAAATAAGPAHAAADGVLAGGNAAGASRVPAGAGAAAAAGTAGDVAMEEADQGYAAQERVVLQEFNAILQKIISNAEKKAGGSAGKDAAAVAAAVAAGKAAAVTAASGVAGAAGGASGPAGASNSSGLAAGMNGSTQPPGVSTAQPSTTQSHMQQLMASAAAAAAAAQPSSSQALGQQGHTQQGHTQQGHTQQGHMQQLIASAAAAAAAAAAAGGPQLPPPSTQQHLPPQFSSQAMLNPQAMPQLHNPQATPQALPQAMPHVAYPLLMSGQAMAPGGMRLGPSATAAPAAPAGMRLLPMAMPLGFNPAGTLAPIAPLATGMQSSSRPALPPITVAAVAESERQQAAAMQAAANAVLGGAGGVAPAAAAVPSVAFQPQASAAAGLAAAGQAAAGAQPS